MWAHSGLTKGLCIEFDASDEGGFFWEAFKVLYQEEYRAVDVMKIGKPDESRAQPIKPF